MLNGLIKDRLLSGLFESWLLCRLSKSIRERVEGFRLCLISLMLRLVLWLAD